MLLGCSNRQLVVMVAILNKKNFLQWDFWGFLTRVLNGHPSNFPNNCRFLHFFRGWHDFLANAPGLHTQDTRKTPKDKTLQKDGFHLTDIAGQKIAEAINPATEDLIKPAELKVHKIETDRDSAKFVIGKKGTRIESLRMKHNVTITTENRKQGDSSYCTITIKGYKGNTDAAAEEIRKYLMTPIGISD